MLVRFGSCELDCDRRELRRSAKPVHVQPQVFDLLVYMVTYRDRVISRDEMVEAVWKGRSVSDVTLNSRVNAARHAIGDDGKRQALIRTVPRRGFRFIGELVDGSPAVAESSETPKSEAALQTNARSIAGRSLRRGSGPKPRSNNLGRSMKCNGSRPRRKMRSAYSALLATLMSARYCPSSRRRPWCFTAEEIPVSRASLA